MKLLIAVFFTAFTSIIAAQNTNIHVCDPNNETCKLLNHVEEYIIIDRNEILTPNESIIKPFAFESQIYQNNIIVVGEQKYLVREIKEGGFMLTPIEQIKYNLDFLKPEN